jgi:hypothetical protein
MAYYKVLIEVWCDWDPKDSDLAGAVLPGGSCPEHQAIGPLPQPRATTNASRDDVVAIPL